MMRVWKMKILVLALALTMSFPVCKAASRMMPGNYTPEQRQERVAEEVNLRIKEQFRFEEMKRSKKTGHEDSPWDEIYAEEQYWHRDTDITEKQARWLFGEDEFRENCKKG